MRKFTGCASPSSRREGVDIENSPVTTNALETGTKGWTEAAEESYCYVVTRPEHYRNDWGSRFHGRWSRSAPVDKAREREKEAV
jgi:hypothetical protein